MAVTSNKFIPLLALVGVLIVGTVMWKQFSGSGPVKSGDALKEVPQPKLPGTAGADNDNASETLKTVVTSNAELRKEVAKVIESNNALMKENQELKLRAGGGAAGAAAAAAAAASAPQAAASESPHERGLFDGAIDSAARAADTFSRGFPSVAGPRGNATSSAAGTAPAAPATANTARPVIDEAGAPGEVRYAVMAPMGYAVQTDAARGPKGVATTRYVRTLTPEGDTGSISGPATAAAQAAATQRPKDIPYFTIPENGTLAGVTAMTSIIGRVPIDGRVTDPMQFKAVVGRDNLAANGFELPGDIAGIIVTGIAIGDMALSCNEGKVRSLTFVFNDGTIRTVSARAQTSGGFNRGNSGNSGDLGFISDLHGNPCISGKFVTNAPAYLTDIIGLRALGVAGQAYAEAQRTTRTNTDGSISGTVTGSAGSYALGQAVSGSTDEVTKWMLQRLKSSFDAVITPSGQQMVVHLDKEIRLDKVVDGRKLVHRQQTQVSAHGSRYGLE